MATSSTAPRFVRWANVMTTTLLRAGIKLKGFGTPMYLLTVRGRKSGQPRTVPIAIVEQDGKRYIMAPYGRVDWVRNLGAAGQATLTRGRRSEVVRASELPKVEAGAVLKRFIESGNPIGRFFNLSRTSSREDFEQKTVTNPVFLVHEGYLNGRL